MMWSVAALSLFKTPSICELHVVFSVTFHNFCFSMVRGHIAGRWSTRCPNAFLRALTKLHAGACNVSLFLPRSWPSSWTCRIVIRLNNGPTGCEGYVFRFWTMRPNNIRDVCYLDHILSCRCFVKVATSSARGSLVNCYCCYEMSGAVEYCNQIHNMQWSKIACDTPALMIREINAANTTDRLWEGTLAG
jgi:hypothetical protein